MEHRRGHRGSSRNGAPQFCCVCSEVVMEGIHSKKKHVSCQSKSRRAQHHLCADCLQGVVTMESEPIRLRASRGLIPCPWRGPGAMMERCSSPEWTFSQVSPFLEPATVNKYVETMGVMLSTLLDAEKGRTSGCRGSGRSDDSHRSMDEKIRDYRHHIAEEILTLRCPRCSVVWDSYDGCDALQCESCGAGFCALCLSDCGPDAHGHAARMHGTYFGGLARFKKTHAKRRRRAVAAFLLALPEPLEVRLRLLDACQVDLAALGINKTDIASILVLGDRVPLAVTLAHVCTCLKDAIIAIMMGLGRGLCSTGKLFVPFLAHTAAALSISTMLVLAWMVCIVAAGTLCQGAHRVALGLLLAMGGVTEALTFSATCAVAFGLFAFGIRILNRRRKTTCRIQPHMVNVVYFTARRRAPLRKL